MTTPTGAGPVVVIGGGVIGIACAHCQADFTRRCTHSQMTAAGFEQGNSRVRELESTHTSYTLCPVRHSSTTKPSQGRCSARWASW